MEPNPTQRAIAAIQTGTLVQVASEEYIETVRSGILSQASKWIDEGQDMYAQIALCEVARLDRLYPPY